MRLTELKLAGYRSIPSELTIRVRPEVTCLIGANEHGKSNILDSLNYMDWGQFAATDKNTSSRKAEHPAAIYSLQLSEDDRHALLDVVEAELEKPVAEDEQSQRSRQFHELSRKYLNAGKGKIDVALSADGSRRVIIPGVVSYAAGNFDAAKQTSAVVKWFIGAMPTVRLFAPTAELVDSISLDELNARKNLPFEGLLKIARGWEGRAELFEDSTKARQRLDQLGRTLTNRIKKIWSQGFGHTYRFDQTNGRLHVSIKDPVAFDVPSRRSLGFRSFLSFYLTLLAETDEVDPEGYILLFDEPGIHLHPQGQKDLLAELRKLARHNQIIYATHSPFMIDRNDPASTVLVYKGTRGKDKGTRVNYKPWGSNWTALSGALGVTPADAFFLPEAPVVVEGTSDKLYLAAYMSLCRVHTGADLNYLTLIDGDRSDDVEAIVRILVGAGRKMVVIIDGDPGGRDWAKSLSRIAGSNRKAVNVLNLGELTAVEKPVSIEDFLPPAHWHTALQKYVTDVVRADHSIDWSELQRYADTRTMGRAAAEYLVAANVIDNVKKFSKTNVAHILCQQDLDVPDAASPIGLLCGELTRRVNAIST